MFRCRSLINLLITIICICISVPAYAAARAQITEGWYKIVPAHAQSKALDVGGAKTNPGANIQLWGYVGAPQQKFYVRHRGDNWYSIKAGNCDLYVDAQGGVPHNGENVHLWNWNGTDAQLWGFIDTTDGFNIYTKMQYNLVFDCEAGRGDDGTNVQLWERGNVAWHRWILIPVEAPGSNTSNGESYVVSTNSASLLLRNGPGSGYGIKARMPRGSVVTVYSIQNGWAEVSYNGIRGYASSSYLTKKSNTPTNLNNNSSDWNSLVGKRPSSLNLNNSCYRPQSGYNPFKKAYTDSNGKYHSSNCTWYAYGRFQEVNGQRLGVTGSPSKWLSQASNNGFNVGTVAKSKSIAVTDRHVMFVEYVENGYVYYTDANAGNDFVVKRKTIADFRKKWAVRGYIYAK